MRLQEELKLSILLMPLKSLMMHPLLSTCRGRTSHFGSQLLNLYSDLLLAAQMSLLYFQM